MKKNIITSFGIGSGNLLYQFIVSGGEGIDYLAPVVIFIFAFMMMSAFEVFGQRLQSKK